MRNTQRIKNFIKKWKNALPNKEVLYEYIPFCKNLLYEEEEIVLETTNLLKNNIELWAKRKSYIYSENRGKILCKENLLNKKKWFVNELVNESTRMATSGSTTGCAFSYLRWDPFFYFIEGINHYDLILDEFKIEKNPNIIYLIENNYKFEDLILLYKKNIIENHGITRNSKVNIVNFKYKNNSEKLFNKLIKYLKNNSIDVILSTGPVINSLCYYIKKFNYKHKICNLLSNTNEFLLSSDVNFLLKNKFIENICDHMRCWDGGASFFTCKYKTYHILDNLSWCESINNKLISTDYFSFPSPFVKYWNGDYCRLEDKYKRCECGRLYREFEFIENRPFSIKGTSFKEIQNKIITAGITSIKQVKCDTSFINIVSIKDLSDKEKNYILNLNKKFKFKFSVEEL